MEAQRLAPFLLLICIGVYDCHLQPESLISTVEDSVKFKVHGTGPRSVLEEYALYKVSTEGDLLLFNFSLLGGSPLKAGRVFFDIVDLFFELVNSTLYDSGAYRLEAWLDGRITYQRNYSLVVCPSKIELHILRAQLNGSVQLCGAGSKGDPMTTIQLYNYSLMSDSPYMLMLDTNSPMERLPEDLTDRLQVDLNSSSVTLQGVTEQDYTKAYVCLILQSGQCQSYTLEILVWERITLYPRMTARLTLPCHIKPTSPHQVYWTTPSGNVTLSTGDSSQVPHNDSQQEEKMYMLNGSQTGDYSLIIPSVKEHGKYSCNRKKTFLEYEISMCIGIRSTNATFSNNETVKLDCLAYGEIQWFRQRGADTEELILDSEDKTVLLPQDLRGRVNTSLTPFSLVIANPTAEDSSVYTCRVKIPDSNSFKPATCLENQIRLHYEDPYGINSAFYKVHASLMGCGLLAMASAVILV
ncbi:hypothetical protein ACEWY4_022811 [Coilia grayii]|uniref:Ig-like domain-containing protein n=1 Tax=Coilia grayii TaxID=363190 RepID=A0ABD1J4S0_9TELE